MALAELSGMVAKPAGAPQETKALVTEIERKIKLVEDVTGEAFTLQVGSLNF